MLTAGNAIDTNTVSAMIFTMTSTAVTFALFEVPTTSSHVMTMAIRNASRLKPPAALVPSGSVIVSAGPAVSAIGSPSECASSQPLM